MRILTFTTLFPNPKQPAQGIFVAQRMKAVAALPGNSVEVVSPLPFAPEWLPIGSQAKYKGIPEHAEVMGFSVHYPRYTLFPKISMPWHSRLMARGVLDLVRRLHSQHKFDCLDAHYFYPDGHAASIIAKELDIPLFVSARGTDINVFPEFRTIRPMVIETAERATGIISVAQSLHDKIQKLGDFAAKSVVITNGIDASRFKFQDKLSARSKLGLDSAQKAIVSVASLNAYKGVGRLVEAAKMLREQVPNLKVFLIGEGPMRSTLQEMISRYGLTDTVTLLGQKSNDELNGWYSAADVVALLSEREGMPNVLIEALACGTPVVATPVGGIPDLLAEPGRGLLVQGDNESICKGFMKALTTEWNQAAISQSMRSRSWEKVALEVQDFFTVKLNAGQTEAVL